MARHGPERDPPAADAGIGEVLFEAMITPHRSLPPRGFAVLMIAVGVVSFVAGIAFAMSGAWPVIGFFGLDVALIYWAFRLNYRAARAVEHVRLTRETLTIRRRDHRGRRSEVSLQPYWLRVERPAPDATHPVRLRSHGAVHLVGAWLSPGERIAFAEALAAALETVRAPPHLAAPPAAS
jgi:uncharacterized membrane protein